MSRNILNYIFIVLLNNDIIDIMSSPFRPNAAIAAAGEARQRTASKKTGEVAVTYSSGTSSSSSVFTDLANLTGTGFGLQLLSFIQHYNRSVYVP